MTVYKFIPNNNQEVFDFAIDYFIGRKDRCTETIDYYGEMATGSVYTNHLGDHCVMGAMFENLPRISNAGIRSIWREQKVMVKKGIIDEPHSVAMPSKIWADLLEALQELHDLAENWEQGKGLKILAWEKLLTIGTKFNLNTDAIYKQLETVTV